MQNKLAALQDKLNFKKEIEVPEYTFKVEAPFNLDKTRKTRFCSDFNVRRQRLPRVVRKVKQVELQEESSEDLPQNTAQGSFTFNPFDDKYQSKEPQKSSEQQKLAETASEEEQPIKREREGLLDLDRVTKRQYGFSLAEEQMHHGIVTKRAQKEREEQQQEQLNQDNLRTEEEKNILQSLKKQVGHKVASTLQTKSHGTRLITDEPQEKVHSEFKAYMSTSKNKVPQWVEFSGDKVQQMVEYAMAEPEVSKKQPQKFVYGANIPEAHKTKMFQMQQEYSQGPRWEPQQPNTPHNRPQFARPQGQNTNVFPVGMKPVPPGVKLNSKGFPVGQTPPEGYVCRKCDKPGHYIADCVNQKYNDPTIIRPPPGLENENTTIDQNYQRKHEFEGIFGKQNNDYGEGIEHQRNWGKDQSKTLKKLKEEEDQKEQQKKRKKFQYEHITDKEILWKSASGFKWNSQDPIQKQQGKKFDPQKATKIEPMPVYKNKDQNYNPDLPQNVKKGSMSEPILQKVGNQSRSVQEYLQKPEIPQNLGQLEQLRQQHQDDFQALKSELKDQSPSDTMPGMLKPFYFKRPIPDLLKEYDIFGFDLQDCICQLQIDYLVKHRYKYILNALCEDHQYPSEVRQESASDMFVYLDNAVWDIDNGTILKLAEGSIVTKAVKGYELLTDHKLDLLYGKDRVYTHLKWPETNKIISQETGRGNHWTFMTPLEACYIPVICKLTDLICKGKVSKSFVQLALDLTRIKFKEQMQRPGRDSSDQLCMVPLGLDLINVGLKPKNSMRKNPQVRHVLETLQKAGKYMFLTSNCCVQYTDLVMNYSIGNDWKQFFTLVMANSRKPLFYKTEAPFFEFDPTQPNGRGRKLMQMRYVFKQTLQKTLTEGNAKFVTDFFQQHCEKGEIKVANFSGHPFNDIWATNEFNLNLKKAKNRAVWHPFFVCPDFSAYEPLFGDSQLVPHNRHIWGDKFLNEQGEGKVRRNLFMSEMEKCARYAVSEMANISMLLKHTDKTQPQELQKALGMAEPPNAKKWISKVALDEFEKSAKSEREYRYLLLPNGLRAMLVHDPDAEGESAVSLKLNCGSLQNAIFGQNIAEIVSEVIQKGSEEYPDRNYFINRVSFYNGQSRIQSTKDCTHFSFQIDSETDAASYMSVALNQMSEIFADFFKQPLMENHMIESAVRTVNNKIQKQPLTNEKIIDKIECEQIHGFQTNKPVEDVKKAVRKFFKEMYSANLMGLCMVSSQSLNNMQEIVENNFQKIKDNNIVLPDYEKDNIFQLKDILGQLYRAKAADSKSQELVIKWPCLPLMDQNWLTKPLTFLEYALNDKTINSLHMELIGLGLANDFKCSQISFFQSNYQGLQMSVKLTQKGSKDYLKVLSVIFAQLNLLKAKPPPAHLIEALKAKMKGDFDKKTSFEEIMSHANFLSEELRQLQGSINITEAPTVTLLYKPYAFDGIKQKLIDTVLTAMTPSNCYVILLADSDQTEKEKLPDCLLQAQRQEGEYLGWPEQPEIKPIKTNKPQNESSEVKVIQGKPRMAKQTAKTDELQGDGKFQFKTEDFPQLIRGKQAIATEENCIAEPPEYIQIAEVMRQKYIDSFPTEGEVRLVLQKQETPVKRFVIQISSNIWQMADWQTLLDVVNEERGHLEAHGPTIIKPIKRWSDFVATHVPSRIWFKESQEGHKAIWMRVQIQPLIIQNELADHFMAQLFCKLVNQFASIDAIKAKHAGAHFNLRYVVSEKSFNAILKTDDLKKLQLFEEIFQKIASFKPIEESFKSLKNSLLEDLNKAWMIDAFIAVAKLKTMVIDPNKRDPNEIRDAGVSVTWQQFETFCKHIFEGINFTWLAQGGLTKKVTQDFIKSCEKSLIAQSSHIEHEEKKGVIIEDLHVISLENQSEVHKPMSSIISSFQLAHGDDRDHKFACLAILGGTIKTYFKEEMAGMDLSKKACFVQVGTYPGGSDYIDFWTQSIDKNPDAQELAINKFLEQVTSKNLYDQRKTFHQTKTKILENLRNPQAQSLEMNALQNWQAIITSAEVTPNLMHLRQREIEAIKDVTIDDVIAVFDEIIYKHPRRLNVKMYSEYHLKKPIDIGKAKKDNAKIYSDWCNYSKPLEVATIEDIENFQKQNLH